MNWDIIGHVLAFVFKPLSFIASFVYCLFLIQIKIGKAENKKLNIFNKLINDRKTYDRKTCSQNICILLNIHRGFSKVTVGL